ncbi:MAG: hypothetical protein J6I86_06730 [Bacteroidaceae bacterium]|nr:hypothetical protein [Bacteroidaceae bacterium]
MSIIKCPECRGQVSTMAGTCPHCGTRISGNLRQCPSCGSYCLNAQDKCPECGTELETIVPQEEPRPQATETQTKPSEKKKKPHNSKGPAIIAIVICLILLCTGYYFYNQHRMEQKEQEDYERLEGVTNPEFYQQFLIDYPDSKHFDEINERMLVLQAEAEDWKQLLKGINRSSISLFQQKHPNSLRGRAIEDMLDSIDWQEALGIGNEEAITDYLAKHPSGRYADDASEMKNTLLLSKVTPEEKAMIRGTLESFFTKAIANQDIEAAKAAIPDTMMNFCGKENANAEAIIEYAKEKVANDVIGLHYAIGQKMEVRKETLPDGNTGFAVEVNLQETISRSDTNQPSSNIYHVNALINSEQKLVRMNIIK